jgi:hypothetical protein
VGWVGAVLYLQRVQQRRCQVAHALPGPVGREQQPRPRCQRRADGGQRLGVAVPSQLETHQGWFLFIL